MRVRPYFSFFQLQLHFLCSRHRSIEELEAPDFKRNQSTDMIRQRAEEKERNREACQNAQPGTIKRMQFTFSVDQHVQQSLHTYPSRDRTLDPPQGLLSVLELQQPGLKRDMKIPS